jgi:hypothetical protein
MTDYRFLLSISDDGRQWRPLEVEPGTNGWSNYRITAGEKGTALRIRIAGDRSPSIREVVSPAIVPDPAKVAASEAKGAGAVLDRNQQTVWQPQGSKSWVEVPLDPNVTLSGVGIIWGRGVTIPPVEFSVRSPDGRWTVVAHADESSTEAVQLPAPVHGAMTVSREVDLPIPGRIRVNLLREGGEARLGGVVIERIGNDGPLGRR